ncbi:hypothetical protein [Streptomyces sp. WAC 04229]|uniref:hypothetical protein n=1 Tax=Streptomyces sp. WAC 04229 TaxID=2203206 RepID=UPI003D745BB9
MRHNFATWEPLLRLVQSSNAEQLAVPGGHVTGQISHGSWSVLSAFARKYPAGYG